MNFNPTTPAAPVAPAPLGTLQITATPASNSQINREKPSLCATSHAEIDGNDIGPVVSIKDFATEFRFRASLSLYMYS